MWYLISSFSEYFLVHFQKALAPSLRETEPLSHTDTRVTHGKADYRTQDFGTPTVTAERKFMDKIMLDLLPLAK